MNQIRTKLTVIFISIIFLLTVVSLYASFLLSKLSDDINQTQTLKTANDDIRIHGLNVDNIISLYVTSDLDRQSALKLEYDYNMDHFHHALEVLKTARKFEKEVTLIEKTHQQFMQRAEKIMTMASQKEEKENGFKTIVATLRENRHKIIDDTSLSSATLKLALADVGYKDKEFNFQYQDKEHAKEWMDSINLLKAALENEGLVSLVPVADAYLENAQKAVAEREAIGNLNLNEGYNLDLARNTFIEIDIATGQIGKVTNQDLTEVLDRSKIQRELALGTILLSFLLGIVVVWLVSRNITRPIYELVKAAQVVSGGQTKHRVLVKGSDELGSLAKVFNQMLDSIEKSQQVLKTSDEQLRKANTNLEEKLAELEKFKEVTVDRELKMVELKEDIKKLKGEENAKPG